MYVEHSGYSKESGSFSNLIYFDETKTDYKAYYPDGTIARQTEPFEYRTEDWNHDGDIYTQFGAFFSYEGRNFFWTPEDMVMSLIKKEVVKIPGIELPGKKKLAIEDQIRKSDLRAEHQEIERNRKMNALGIRPPGEPWAR